MNSTLDRPFGEKLGSSPPPICRLDWCHDPVSQPDAGCLDGRPPSLIHPWGCVPATRSGTATSVGSRSGGRRWSSDSSICHLAPRGFFSREGTGVCAPRQPAPIDPTTRWLLTFRICMHLVPIYQAPWRDPTSHTSRFGRINAPNFGCVTSVRAPKWGGPPQSNAVKMEMSPPHFGAG